MPFFPFYAWGGFTLAARNIPVQKGDGSSLYPNPDGRSNAIIAGFGESVND